MHAFFLGQFRRYAAQGVRPPQFTAMGVPDPSGEEGKYESLGLLLSHGPGPSRQSLYFEISAAARQVHGGPRMVEWSIYTPTAPPEGLILVGWLTARMDGGPCCLRGPEFADGLPVDSVPALVAWGASGDALFDLRKQGW